MTRELICEGQIYSIRTEVLTHLARDPGGVPLAAIGFSLGANLPLKYLGERGGYPAKDPHGPLLGAGITVSPPFVLRDAMLRLNQGVSRLYRSHLQVRHQALPRGDLDSIRDFNAFDERITAPCAASPVSSTITTALVAAATCPSSPRRP
ncbi:MAG: hypothetical protein WAT36_14065 [Chromatiaceae bacterium]